MYTHWFTETLKWMDAHPWIPPIVIGAAILNVARLAYADWKAERDT